MQPAQKVREAAHVRLQESAALSQDDTTGGHLTETIVIFETIDQSTDVLSRLKTLQDSMAKSLNDILLRLESLEAKSIASVNTDADLPEKDRDSPFNLSKVSRSNVPKKASIISEFFHCSDSSQSAASTPTRKSLIEAAKERDVLAMTQGLDRFVIEALPLNRRHANFHFPLHTCFRVGCFLLLITFFSLFIVWGFIKLCTPVKNNEMEVSEFVKIRHERKMWRGDEVPAPKTLCVGSLAKGLEVTAKYGVIPQGDASRRVYTDLSLVTRDVITRSGISKNSKCITSQPLIVGQFGDSWYKYISFALVAPVNLSVQPRAALLAEARIGGFETANVSIYYTFSDMMWTGVEVLLARLVRVEGDSFGISRLMPAKYAEYLGKQGLAVDSHYTRMEKPYIDPKTNKQVFARFYVRASEVEREDTYSPYAFLKLLMDSGGLWTALSLVAAVSVLSCFYCGRACVQVNRKARGVSEKPRTFQSEVHDEQASASLKMHKDEDEHGVQVKEAKVEVKKTKVTSSKCSACSGFFCREPHSAEGIFSLPSVVPCDSRDDDDVECSNARVNTHAFPPAYVAGPVELKRQLSS